MNHLTLIKILLLPSLLFNCHLWNVEGSGITATVYKHADCSGRKMQVTPYNNCATVGIPGISCIKLSKPGCVKLFIHPDCYGASLIVPSEANLRGSEFNDNVSSFKIVPCGIDMRFEKPWHKHGRHHHRHHQRNHHRHLNGFYPQERSRSEDNPP